MKYINFYNVLMSFFIQLHKQVTRWVHRARQRNRLEHIETRLLDDMGLNTAAVATEVRKPFWRA